MRANNKLHFAYKKDGKTKAKKGFAIKPRKTREAEVRQEYAF